MIQLQCARQKDLCRKCELNRSQHPKHSLLTHTHTTTRVLHITRTCSMVLIGVSMRGPFPLITSNSIPSAGRGVRMSLKKITPSGLNARQGCSREVREAEGARQGPGECQLIEWQGSGCQCIVPARTSEQSGAAVHVRVSDCTTLSWSRRALTVAGLPSGSSAYIAIFAPALPVHLCSPATRAQ